MDEVCNGMIFGTFGKVEGSLIINLKSGALILKTLVKDAKL